MSAAGTSKLVVTVRLSAHLANRAQALRPHISAHPTLSDSSRLTRADVFRFLTAYGLEELERPKRRDWSKAHEQARTRPRGAEHQAQHSGSKDIAVTLRIDRTLLERIEEKEERVSSRREFALSSHLTRADLVRLFLLMGIERLERELDAPSPEDREV